MTPLIPVLYACLRVLPAIPCPSFVIEDGMQICCHDEPIVEHELRTRLEEPLDCSLSNCWGDFCAEGTHCAVREAFAEGDWTCYPLIEGDGP